jgi:hypothetical protein
MTIKIIMSLYSINQLVFQVKAQFFFCEID